MPVREVFSRLKARLGGLSFRTGMVVAGLCVVCYIISFAQALLPISATAKWVLWVIFFGLAKTTQYMALLILGASGVKRLKSIFRKLKRSE